MNEVIQEANYRYNWQLLSEAGNLPLDLARSLLTAHSTSIVRAQCAGRKRLTGSHVQCPRCNTPRIANLIRSRLLGCPRKKQDIRKLIRKEKKWPKKLTFREKSLLEAFHSRRNTIEVTCLVCHHKMRELIPVLGKNKIIPQVVLNKKKKKRSVKEVNAGLTLQPKRVSNNLADVEIRRKKKTFKITENINREERRVGELSELDEALAQRIEKSIIKSSGTEKASSSNGSLKFQGSEPTSIRDKAFKARKEKRKKLACLRNSVIKDIILKENSKMQNNTLGDFLGSLF